MLGATGPAVVAQGASEDYFSYASYAAGADGVPMTAGVDGDGGNDFDASLSERGAGAGDAGAAGRDYNSEDDDDGHYRDTHSHVGDPDNRSEPDALEELADDAEETGTDPTCRDVQEVG